MRPALVFPSNPVPAVRVPCPSQSGCHAIGEYDLPGRQRWPSPCETADTSRRVLTRGNCASQRNSIAVSSLCRCRYSKSLSGMSPSATRPGQWKKTLAAPFQVAPLHQATTCAAPPAVQKIATMPTAGDRALPASGSPTVKGRRASRWSGLVSSTKAVRPCRFANSAALLIRPACRVRNDARLKGTRAVHPAARAAVAAGSALDVRCHQVPPGRPARSCSGITSRFNAFSA